jgi:hypothetical protein
MLQVLVTLPEEATATLVGRKVPSIALVPACCR